LKSVVSDIANALPTIQRGDVIVFVPPGKDIHYIKRVVGLPGETVSIANNKITICKTNTSDCFTLDESYIPSDYKTEATCGISKFEVEEGLFVMGDNREHSTDSRCCFTIGCYGDTK
jgi:signal peptidase I